MSRRLVLTGLAILLLAGCDTTYRNFSEKFSLPWLESSSSSSVITMDLSASSASSSELPLPDEPSFADEVVSTGATISSVSPRALSGALIERVLSGGILEFGLQTAPILRVYTHPSCVYCREFEEEQLEKLTRDFVQSGALRIQTMIVPLTKYPASALQASALLCSAEQGRGQDMLHALFSTETLDTKGLTAIAKSLKLGANFDQCLSSAKTADAVRWQAALAVSEQVTLVPTFDLYGNKQTGLPRYPDLRGWIDTKISRRGE